MSQYNPVCPECTGWLEEQLHDSGKWLKCMSCGYMRLLNKRIVIPLPDKHEKKREGLHGWRRN